MTTKAQTTHGEEAVFVYEAPLRLWHWINAISIIVLTVTGYFIGSPMASVPGEASDNFLFGWIRYIHFSAAYILIFAFLFRIYWAIVGNKHARQMFIPQIWSGKWWSEVWHETKWYAFLVREPKKYVGHNPLATLVMHVMLVWGTIFMIVTGLALYGEGKGARILAIRLVQQLGHSALWPEPRRAHLASSGHVVHHLFCHHPYLCSVPRGRDVPPIPDQHHDFRLADVQRQSPCRRLIFCAALRTFSPDLPNLDRRAVARLFFHQQLHKFEIYRLPAFTENGKNPFTPVVSAALLMHCFLT